MMEVVVFLQDPRSLYQRCGFFGIGGRVCGPVGTTDGLYGFTKLRQCGCPDKQEEIPNNCFIFTRSAIHVVN